MKPRPYWKPGNETQRTLFTGSLQDQFVEWVRQNDEMVTAMVAYAREAKAAGHQRYGVAALVERARWNLRVEKKNAADFKINNNVRSRLARFLMQAFPDLKGMFETRQLKRD
jgi:hypothetical protein